MKYFSCLFLTVVCLAQTVITGRVIVAGKSTVGAAGGGGGSISVTVADVTNTQARLVYTAPSSSACTVEISESATYSPVVYDVNATLFTGANSDARSSGVTNGTARVFIAGARRPDVASDSNVYSRALQASTLHYFRVNCSGNLGTGTFTTDNLPVGSTFNEPPPTAPAGFTDPNPVYPGFGFLLPTICDTTGTLCPGGPRTQKVVDPQTGILYSTVSLPGDQVGGMSGSRGLMIYDGAQQRVFGDTTITDPVTGLPAFVGNLENQVGYHSAFLLIPSTGESRLLGLVNVDVGGNKGTNANLGTDSKIVFAPQTIGGLYTSDYLDNFAAHVGGVSGSINFSAGSLLTGQGGNLVTNFDATFDASKFSCEGLFATAGNYSFSKCTRAGQDSYGWVVVFYGGDGRIPTPSSCMIGDALCPRVVGAWYTYKQPPTKWCGIHQTVPVPNAVVQSVNWHGLDTNSQGLTTVGLAAVETTITTGSSSGTAVIHVAGNPTSVATGGDSESTQTIEAGDLLRINGTGNGVVKVASRSGNNVTLTANLTDGTTTGQTVQMTCNVAPGTDGVWALTYWDALNDVHGTDTTGMTVVPDYSFPGGGHFDTGPLGRTSESGNGYQTSMIGAGTVLQSLNGTVINIDSTAAWNGVAAPGFGVLTNKHPSYHQLTSSPYFFDRPIFSGNPGASGSGDPRYYSDDPGVTLVSGSLWQYHSAPSYPLQRKLIPTQAINGGQALLDISQPATGNIIGTTGSDFNKYCVAYKANECRSGSTAGDIFVNVFGFDYNRCTGDQNPYIRDICIHNLPAYAGAMMQWYLGTSSPDAQSKSRNLGWGMTGPRNAIVYPLAKTVADESYTLFTMGFQSFDSGGYGEVDTWKAKMTTLPTPDGVNRTGYISTPIVVSAGVQNNVIVKFWYDENKDYTGTPRCGSRADDCYATSATVPAGANPYAYAVDGTSGTLATLAGLSCASGCTVAVPAVTGHMLHTAVIYRDVSNGILSTGVEQIVKIP